MDVTFGAITFGFLGLIANLGSKILGLFEINLSKETQHYRP